MSKEDLEEKFAREVREVFTIEAREHCESLEKLLLDLEKNLNDSSMVDQIFRVVHTLKGSAFAADLNDIANLAHEMETTLHYFKESLLEVDRSKVELLLKSNDHLLESVETEKTDKKTYQNLINNLKSLNEQAAHRSKSKSKIQEHTVEHAPVTPKDTKVINKITESSFIFRDYELDLNKKNNNFYQLNISAAKLRPKESLEKVIKKLGLHSEIIQIICDHIIQGSVKTAPLKESQHLNILLAPNASDTEVLRESGLNKKSCQVSIHSEEVVTAHSLNGVVFYDTPPSIHPYDPKKNMGKGKNLNQDLPTGTTSPAKTVRIRVEILDQLMRLASELVLVRNQQLRILDRTDDKIRSSTQRLDNITTEIQSQIMATRMQPIGNIFTKYERIVRDLSLKLNKKIQLRTEGNEVELDKTILENLADPLMHIIRNCCDHGIEDYKTRVKANKDTDGLIVIRAFHEGGLVNIEIKDDGQGISVEKVKEKALKKGIKSAEELIKMSHKDIMQLIFHPGFSTSDIVSDISGRGFGMDIVRMNIEKLGGSIDIKSVQGKGTEIFLRLPLTLAIIPCLIVTCRDQVFAIPQVNLEELIGLTEEDALKKIDYMGNREVFRVRGGLLPLIRLHEVLEHHSPFTEDNYFNLMKSRQQYRKQRLRQEKSLKERMFLFAVLKAGNKRFGLVVDEINGTEEVVISPMHPTLKNIQIYSGATVRGDGKVSLILDAFGISEFTRIFDSEHYKNVKQKYKKQHYYEERHNLEPLLLFSHSKNEQFSIEQRDIKRVVKIKQSQVQAVSKYDFITLYDEPTLILYLDDYVEVSKPEHNDEAFLIMPKGTDITIGIYATSLTDIGNYQLKEFKDFRPGLGISGSSLINGKITLHLDLPFLLNECQKVFSSARNLTAS